jgi:hypothetical protein
MGRSSRAKGDRRQHREREAARARRQIAALAPADHRLRCLAEARDAAQAALEAEVRSLLLAGHSWTMIGAGLGVSRQGARQRYHRIAAAEVESTV